MVVLRWAAATDTGQVRSTNQDAILVQHPLFAVADGMGGHAAGEVASATALAALRTLTPAPPTVDDLADGVEAANQAVFDQASTDPALRGMGTTMVALALFDAAPGVQHLALANVGDSRAYLLRDGRLQQLTRDHSYVADLVAAGQITEDEALHHPNRNMLTRALGVDRSVRVDAWDLVPLPGDRYLLCSDGLFNEVLVDRLTTILDTIAEPDELVSELVLRANASGGRDNISVVIIDVHEGDADGSAAGAAGGTAVGGWLDGEGGAAYAGATSNPPATEQFGAAPVPTPVSPPEVPLPAPPEPKARRFTWRVGVFLLSLLILVGVAFGGTVYYGRNTWYVAFAEGQVAVFRGKPDGFLWMDPTLEQVYPLAPEAVPPSELAKVTEGVEFTSRSDAEAYVRNLATLSAELGLTPTETIPTTSTTTTSTTLPATTTTTLPPTTTSAVPLTDAVPPPDTTPTTAATTP